MRTDRHYEANCFYSQFANALKKKLILFLRINCTSVLCPIGDIYGLEQWQYLDQRYS